MHFLAALQFLTTIAFPWRRRVSPEELGRPIPYFPVVGLIIGLILAGLSWIFSLILPPAVANALLIVFLVMVTGARHLSGLVHTCDAIAVPKPAAERLQVMRDSRSGAFGVIGVVLLLLVKYISLSNLPGYLMTPVLVFMPVVSRWAMTYTVFVYSSAQSSELDTLLKQGTRWPGFTIATIITVVIALLLIPLLQFTGLAIIFSVWLITVIMATYFKSAFNGLGIDNYGTINEVAEVSVFIIVILLARIGLA